MEEAFKHFPNREMFKKAQTRAGLVTGLVFGIASLVIASIIAFVIVSTLTGANLMSTYRTTTTVTNESGYINETGYNLSNATAIRAIPSTISITLANNETLDVPATNYTVSSSGTITNATATTYDEEVNITYTMSLYTVEEATSDDMSANFTEGVDNVSEKIPTVLLVATVVLIIGVLVLLVGAWQKMRLGGGSI